MSAKQLDPLDRYWRELEFEMKRAAEYRARPRPWLLRFRMWALKMLGHPELADELLFRDFQEKAGR